MDLETLQHCKLDLLDENCNIFGIRGLKEKYNLTKSDFEYIKNFLLQTGEYDHIMQVCKRKQAKYRCNLRNSKQVRYSEESKKRMKVSQKIKWETIKNTEEGQLKIENAKKCMSLINKERKNQTTEAKQKRVQSRKLNYPNWFTEEAKENHLKAVREHAKTRILSENTRKKMSDSAIARGNCKPVGWRHSDNTKNKLSEITKQMHIDGKFPPAFKSKGHSLLENAIINLGYNVTSEFRIGRNPYDLYISELNLLLEFNGTYWHLDPRIYNADYYDKSKDRFAKDVWDYDFKKMQNAIQNGYNIEVIWQQDLENCNDLHTFILSIIKKYEN